MLVQLCKCKLIDRLQCMSGKDYYDFSLLLQELDTRDQITSGSFTFKRRRRDEEYSDDDSEHFSDDSEELDEDASDEDEDEVCVFVCVRALVRIPD